MQKIIFLIVSAVMTAVILMKIFQPTNMQMMRHFHDTQPKTADARILPRAIVVQEQEKGLSGGRARNRAQALFQPIRRDQIIHDPNFIFTERLKHADTYPIAYQANVLEQRQVGDQLHFKVAELGIDVEGTIQAVEAVDRDIHRWRGTFNRHNHLHNFSILQSRHDRYSIIQLQTAHGLYVAEIKNGLGVIRQESMDLNRDQA